MAFGSSRGWHRMAVAIEDAGMIIQPTMFLWGYSSGFPKATRVDKQIEDPALAKDWSPYRYGGQALKPACEPIIVFQKPFEGRPIDNMVETGAGALNIDAGRIGSESFFRSTGGFNSGGNSLVYGDSKGLKNTLYSSGRWPANLVLQHQPGCKITGQSGESYQINRWQDNMHPFGNGAGNEFESEEMATSQDTWECVDGCAIKKENENQEMSKYFFNSGWQYEVEEQLNEKSLFYEPKVSVAEREAGCDELDGGKGRENFHPSLKPLRLTKYLSSMLLPPERYAPRRILVPFSGVASEMIGAMLAGWDEVVGVELTPEYIPIAEARLSFWGGWKDRGFTEPREILKKIAKKETKKTITQDAML
jgi:hypothetical protein